MSYDNQPTQGDDERLIPWNVFLSVWTECRRLIVAWSFGLTVVVAALGATYLFWLQPTRSVSTLDFRPTFAGAEADLYPNGLVFSASDIAAQPILDIIYETNNIQDYCPREVFRGGFFVEQWSSQAQFLELEYAALLSNQGLSAVDRGRLELEYEARYDALPLQFRLTYVHPLECALIPQVLVAKSLADVLSTWASESETKRGVLAIQVSVLSPSIMDVGEGLGSLHFLRADLLRTSLLRILVNVEEVLRLPGSDVVRVESDAGGFAEIHAKLTDLVESIVAPLVITAGRSMSTEAVAFITEHILTAERAQTAAQGQSAAYRDALREYSGVALSADADRASAQLANTSSSDMQTLQPQIDRTFIDRIVDMSEGSTTFRQELTEEMVDRTVLAVDSEARANYYRQLLSSMTGGRQGQIADADLEARLNQVADQGKQLISQFNELYLEFSQVSLRTASALYQTDSPVFTQILRTFTMRTYVLLVTVTFFSVFFLAFAAYLIRNLLKTSSAVL